MHGAHMAGGLWVEHSEGLDVNQKAVDGRR